MHSTQEESLAIQDQYLPEFRHCYGCGPDNTNGWHIKSYARWPEVIARFTPAPHHTGGVPHNLYGGLLAAILDCHGTAAAAAFYHRNEGFTIGIEPLARCVTASLTVNFIKPTPMGRELELFSTLQKIEGRKVFITLAVKIGDQTYCEGSMLAIRVKE